MTAKTIHKRAVNVFDMKKLRLRAKKIVKQRHGKIIKKSDVDKVWKDYCEYGIIQPLLKYGIVEIDKNFSIEIVGKRIIDDPRVFNMFKNGIGLHKKIGQMATNRPGLFYKIKVTDNNYKNGKLIFEANPKLSKRVHEELKNTTNYYRIEL